MKQEIILGDCLEVMRGFADKSFDLVLTDIPYGISKEHGGLREIDYGEWDKNVSPEMVGAWVSEIARVSKGSVYIFCADQQFSQVFNQLEGLGMIVRKYEWLKTNPNVMNGQHFWLSSGELCVCAKWPGAYYNGNCEKAYKIIGAPTDRNHPTEKPISIFEEFITRSSKEGDSVLDPFNGAGTTTRAAKNLNRNATGIEISPEYCEVAQKRLEQDTLL